MWFKSTIDCSLVLSHLVCVFFLITFVFDLNYRKTLSNQVHKLPLVHKTDACKGVGGPHFQGRFLRNSRGNMDRGTKARAISPKGRDHLYMEMALAATIRR